MIKVAVAVTFFSMLLIADGKTVYENKCASCHQEFLSIDALKENFVDHNNTKLKLKGPTINQLSFRLKQNIGDPHGDEEIHLMEVSEFIKEYVYEPNKEKSICMDEVIEAFETMPSLKGQVSEDELDEVSEWIYNYDKGVSRKLAPTYSSFEEAVQKAKKENKFVMIKATSEHCHYCKKMDHEVFSDPEVISAVEDSFVAVEIDIYKEQLPKGVQTKLTPTFFFLDSDKNIVKKVPGSWDKEDFLEILKEVKGEKK